MNEQNTNNEEKSIMINVTIYDTLDLIVEAAKNNPNKELLQELEHKIAQKEEVLKQNRPILEEEMYEDEYNLILMQKNSEKTIEAKTQKYNNNIEDLNNRIKEYELDFKEQEAKMHLEKTEYEELKKGPQTRENKLKLAELEWGLEAYNEYLDFMHEEIDRFKVQISKEQALIKATKRTEYNKLKRQIEIFNNKYNVEFGKINPTIDTHPLILNLIEEIDALKADKTYHDNPEKLKEEIIQAMENQESEELIREKLEKLVSLTNGPIVGIIDKKKAGTVDEELKKLIDTYNSINDRYQNSDYVNLVKQAEDKKRIEETKQLLEETKINLEEAERKFKISGKQRNVSAMKRELKETKSCIESYEKNKDTAEKYPAMTKAYNDMKKRRQVLETEINELENEPKYNRPLLAREINECKYRIDECEELIKELDQKNESDYIDYEAKANDKGELEKLQNRIQELKSAREDLAKHDKYELSSSILAEYKNKLEIATNTNEVIAEETAQEIELEEIEETVDIEINEEEMEETIDFEEAKPTLIEKITSIGFIQKATQFINTIKEYGSSMKKENKEQKSYIVEKELMRKHNEMLAKEMVNAMESDYIANQEDYKDSMTR